MRLISKVLGFVLSKAFLAGAMTVMLFVGYLAIGELQEAVGRQNTLEQVASDRRDRADELADLRGRYSDRRTEAQRAAVEFLLDTAKDEADRGRQNLADQRRRVNALNRDRTKACTFFRGKPADLILPGHPCEDARKAAEAAKARLNDLQRRLDDAEHDIAVLEDPDLSNGEKLERLGENPTQVRDEALERQIAVKTSEVRRLTHEEKRLSKKQESWAGRVVRQWGESRDGVLREWSRVWMWLLGIVLLVLLAPPVLRTVAYFILMPWVSRVQKPLQLAAEPEHASATLQTSPAERTLPIRLPAGEVLSARSEYVRPVQGNAARSRLLYDWSAPFISYAAGLAELSRITGGDDGTEATLATPDDPNAYLMRIDFEEHPGVVMRPRHVVGVIGAPELKTRWRWGIQALATWQVRYVLFAGTGSLIVQGGGDVVTTRPGDRSTKMEQHLMMGFDSRLTVRVDRTEVFWPYLWGKTSLIDDEFSGPHAFFWQKSDVNPSANPVAKVFNAVFSALGKLLGF